MKKLAVFCLPGLDNFLQWVPHLEDEYEIRMCVTSDNQEVFRGMAWADIIFAEWANEMAVNISRSMINTPNAADKKVIIRLHRYEVFTELPNRIIWEDVDFLVFVAPHIEKTMEDRFPHVMKLMDGKTVVVPNGADLDNIELLNPGHGLNIAVVGGISHKKNPPMVLQVLKKLRDVSGEDYKVHWAGSFQEPIYEIYLKHMVKELRLEKSVTFYGHLSKEEMDEFWKGKNYYLLTSVHEGHNVSALEAGARGIRPIIHGFYGAQRLYGGFDVFLTIDEAVHEIIEHGNPILDEIINVHRKKLEWKGWTLVKQVAEFKRIFEEL